MNEPEDAGHRSDGAKTCDNNDNPGAAGCSGNGGERMALKGGCAARRRGWVRSVSLRRPPQVWQR